ncbi:hypothetical protein HMPREF0454_01724 [Hafnia alvei ATCC 51873]|uniref:Uncharacterized protein n=1 Tax=Hafnia alvei ATCC 51873 TaxID=1002364 RepID=G9Y597_HAFAL|nr:hypothetical protein HMPREF0454_01724 [Hafnia alvei ATCC 51873]
MIVGNTVIFVGSVYLIRSQHCTRNTTKLAIKSKITPVKRIGLLGETLFP